MEEIQRIHELEKEEIENINNSKLTAEYTKYGLLEKKLFEMRKEFEDKLEELELVKKEDEYKIHDEYASKLHDKDIHFEKVIRGSCDKYS